MIYKILVAVIEKEMGMFLLSGRSGDKWAKEGEGGIRCGYTRSVRVAKLGHRETGIFRLFPREELKRYGHTMTIYDVYSLIGFTDLPGFYEILV